MTDVHIKEVPDVGALLTHVDTWTSTAGVAEILAEMHIFCGSRHELTKALNGANMRTRRCATGRQWMHRDAIPGKKQIELERTIYIRDACEKALDAALAIDPRKFWLGDLQDAVHAERPNITPSEITAWCRRWMRRQKPRWEDDLRDTTRGPDRRHQVGFRTTAPKEGI